MDGVTARPAGKHYQRIGSATYYGATSRSAGADPGERLGSGCVANLPLGWAMKGTVGRFPAVNQPLGDGLLFLRRELALIVRHCGPTIDRPSPYVERALYLLISAGVGVAN